MVRFLLYVVFLAVWTGLVSCGHIRFDKGRYLVKWTRKDDKIVFRVEVQTIGWISFGFALQAPTGMRGYDLMMGGVENGKGYIGDYYTYGFGVPGKDPDQDFTLTHSSEKNGRTYLEFVRLLKTGQGRSDTPDIQLTDGRPVYFVWAYNSNGDRITQRHTRRGTSRVKHILAKVGAKPTIAAPLPAKPTPHVPHKPAPHVPHKPAPHVPQKPAPQVPQKPYVPRVDPRQNFVSFDGGRFLASWVYDRKAGKLIFKLDVATTGWVSFGMAHKAPNKMKYYDVIIGGVMDDGIKYIYDYNTIGQRAPVLDIFQDYTMINASEVNGKTLLEYERKFRTEDIFYGDVQFWEGEKMALVWAYHSKNDSTGPDTYEKHTNRGTSGNVKYDIAPKKEHTPKGPSHQQYQKQLQAKKQKRRRRALSDDAKANSASFDGGKYTVSWTSDESTKKIRFKVEVQATGWVSFGFAKKAPNSMKDYDVVVGGVLASGQGYLYDYHTNGRNIPPRDAKQDYTLTGSSETNGKTMLMFERLYQTGDKDDVQFLAGNQVHLVWAYESNGDSYGPDYFTKHTSRGWSSIKYNMVAAITKPTATPKTLEVKVDPLSKKVTFDGGKFGVSWRYDASEGKIHIDLEVRTTGWVGFGFAKRAPNKMKAYDVVVGGVLDQTGQGYLYDYYTSGFGLPPLDKSQDYKLTSSSQKNGKTYLAFERKLKTGDPDDVQIAAGDKFHLIWAYSENVDSFGPVSFSRHSSRGSSGVTYEVVAKDDVDTPTSDSVTTPTTSPEAVSVPANPSTAKLHSAIFDNGKFKVSWKFDPNEDKIAFRLDVQASGWVGFGFAKSAPNSMQDYDIIIGGALDSGLGYLYDYYTNGFSRPPLDPSQDYKLIRAAQNNGKTTIEFERKRDTGDKNDVQFTEGAPMYMVWAHNAQDSFGPLSFLKHNERGTSDLQYDIAVKEVTAEPSSSASQATTSTSSSSSTSASVIDTSSAWPDSSTTIESSSTQSLSASQTPLPSPTKEIPSSTATMAAVSTPVNKEPAAPTPVVEASESKKIQIEEATAALPEIHGSESTPTTEKSTTPEVVIEEVPETKKDATNEIEETVSPEVINFEPNFDLRSRSSALWPSMLSICVAALVYNLVIFILT